MRRLDIPAVTLAGWLVGALISIWAARLVYPYDLEWMEGGMLSHAWRLANGLPLYVAPNPDFIPFVYPPGFSAIVAVVGQWFGLTPWTGRLVALSGVAAACGAMGWGLWRHTGDKLVGALAAALFLGTYSASGAFMDMARPDTLFVGTLAWALVLGAERRKGAEIAAGWMLAVSFTMKQNAAAFGLPILLGIWARDDWRVALRFGLAAALPAGAFTLFMQVISEGRFLVYLIDVPSSHPQLFDRVLPGMFRETGTAMPWVVALPAVWLVLRVERWLPGLPPALGVGMPVVAGIGFGWVGTNLWDFGPETLPVPSAFAFFGAGAGAVALGLGGLGWVGRWLTGGAATLGWRWVYGLGAMAVALSVGGLMRAHNGGYLNVYMHMHWVLVFAFGLTLAALRRDPRARPIAALVVSLQLGWMIGRLDRDRLVPSAEDRQVGDRWVTAIGAYEGPVLSPFAAWLPVQAGKDPSLHLMALWDLNYAGGPYYDDIEVIRDAIRAHRWEAAIDGPRHFGYGLADHYRQVREIGAGEKVFQHRTGWLAKPTKVLEPKP